MLNRMDELLEDCANSRSRQRERRPRMPDLRGKIEDARYAWEDRREASPRAFPRVRRTSGRLLAGEGLIADARERVRPWHAVPAVIALLALLAGGFWLGGIVGGHASAAVLTKTLKIKGKIITVNGARYVSTPAVTVKVKGKTVRIPAKTVRLPVEHGHLRQDRPGQGRRQSHDLRPRDREGADDADADEHNRHHSHPHDKTPPSPGRPRPASSRSRYRSARSPLP